MMDQNIVYNKRSVTRMLILLLIMAGGFFTTLDLIIQENSFWYPFTLTILAMVILVLHEYFKYVYTKEVRIPNDVP